MDTPDNVDGVVPLEVATDAKQADGPVVTTGIAPLAVKEPRAGKLLPLTPAPRPRRPNFQTLPHVRREMARVYRDIRHGRIESQEGTRMTYVLTQIAKITQVSELDARIEAVERALRMRSP